MKRSFHRVLLLGALLSVASGAGAQTTKATAVEEGGDSGSEVEMNEARLAARQLFVEGSQKAQEENWTQALELYRSSQALYPHSTTLYNMGYCSGRLGDYATAWFSTFAALHPTTEDGENRQLTEENTENAQSQLQIFELQLGRLELRLPEGTSVLVDGRHPVSGDDSLIIALPHEDGPRTPLPSQIALLVTPGEHSLHFQGTEASEIIKVVISAGDVVHLIWPGPTAPTPVGSMETSLAKEEPPSTQSEGLHPGPLEAGERVGSEKTDQWLKRGQWVGFSVGAAGGITMLVAGIVALNAASDLAPLCDAEGICPPYEASKVTQHERAHTWANAGFWVAVSGTCVGVGATLLRWRLKDKKELQAEALPGGIRFSGSF